MSDPIPTKSDTELYIEAFADKIKEIHPNPDREELREAVSGYVRDAVEAADREGDKNQGEGNPSP